MAASHSSFGAPCAAPIVTLVRNDGVRIPLHRELVPLVSMLCDLTEAMGCNLVPGWCWGYACRRISGTNVWSNHAKGTAVDVNAPLNPYASAEWHRRNANAHPFGLPRRTNIPQRVFELWEAHGFGDLGVKYSSKPDPMHFGFTRSVTECRAITARLKAHLAHPDSALPQPAPSNTGELMYRICWFTGEPSASGDQRDTTAAYRCLMGKAENKGTLIPLFAWWIADPAELKVWHDRGLKEDVTRRPIGSHRSCTFYGGPFKRVQTPR